MQLQLRWTAAPDDLHVPPQDALRVAGAERLHGGFLRGESSGKMNGRFTPAHAVRDFAFGENTGEETRAVSVDRGADAADVGGVQSQADNAVGHGYVTQA